ncbi:MAG: hypothetical protein QOI73_343 [Solirubrobacteraceae bacterium]|nr:hypothetical protein [Solirubrobacteraceae bacterium]
MLWGIGLAVFAAAPAAAAGDTSGGASAGGAFASEAAVISAVSCVARCATTDSVKPGSLVRLRGKRMRSVRKVVFLGARGPADDITVKALRARSTSVDAIVPDKAPSGPLMAINRDSAPSRASRATVSILRIGASSGPLDVKVVGRRVFLGAARPARVDVLAHSPLTVMVTLVRLADGATVASWPLGALAADVVRTVTWDGTIGGAPQPAGRYEFRVTTQAAAQAAQLPEPLSAGAFELVDHKFPVRAKHNFGEGIAAFGAQRNGHVHQGQDVFADCGTPLVAARGGVVKLNQNEANAGNYIVIDGAGTDVDYVYMHLRERSPLAKGASVLTGQLIGAVGRTGDATACHLHFEMWTGPGWYSGGAPVDPLPSLRAWDAYS